jgi:hypothetical protein
LVGELCYCLRFGELTPWVVALKTEGDFLRPWVEMRLRAAGTPILIMGVEPWLSGSAINVESSGVYEMYDTMSLVIWGKFGCATP